jgi:hypothetical protein
LSVEVLLGAHRDIYGPESEKRLVALLQQELLAILSGTPPRPTDAGRKAEPPVPLAADGKRTDRWLTVGEVAERLKLRKGTLANWRCSGVGPRAFRIGSSIYYLESVVDAWERVQINGDKP